LTAFSVYFLKKHKKFGADDTFKNSKNGSKPSILDKTNDSFENLIAKTGKKNESERIHFDLTNSLSQNYDDFVEIKL
jgi:hypothetical protein